MALELILVLVFLPLGGIHFYWAFGGKWGTGAVFPTKEGSGDLTMKPPTIATLVVAFGLCIMGMFYLLHADVISISCPAWIIKYGQWIIPSIFLIRAIGDFRYVGFFKSVKNTKFAKMDSKLFAPLCLFIAVAGFLTALDIF